MTVRRTLLAAALVLFLAQTAIVLSGVGFTGFFAAVNLNQATRLMFLDLVITLVLISVWMGKDAAASGRNAAPYLALTLLLGSAGPLLYLLGTREEGPGGHRPTRRQDHDARSSEAG